MHHRFSTLAKILATGAWIGAVAFALTETETYQTALASTFFCFALLTATVIHLRIYPHLRDALGVVLLVAVFAAVDFGILRFRMAPAAWLSFLGCGSLLALGIRALWSRPEQRVRAIAAVAAASLFIASDWMASTFLDWTEKLHPKTLDLYLLSFDGSLGMQPSFAVGELFLRWHWLWWLSLAFYVGLPLSMAIVYASHLVTRTDLARAMMFAFVVTGPLGVLFYNLFPATGPVHILTSNFPAHPLSSYDVSHLLLEPISVNAPRNAIPSLHMAWVVLAWWWSRGLAWWVRGISLGFVIFTIVATLGTGEHYLIDLVVALPFALLIQAVSTFFWREGWVERLAPILAGALGTVVWLLSLRFSAGFFWISPAIPWLLIVLTVIICWGAERRYCRFPERDSSNAQPDLQVISATAD